MRSAWRGAFVAVALLVIAWEAPVHGAYSLPSVPAWAGGCALGVGTDLTLHSSAMDTRHAWGIDNSGGERVDLLWPAAYVAQFTPQLKVLDASGQVVAHEGDLIIGRCLLPPHIDRSNADLVRVYAAQIRPPTWKPGDG
jgi:hypothetical protein